MVNLFSWISKSQLVKGLGVILLGFSLASCSDTDGPPADITGIAARGAAIVGKVYVIDADGKEISEAINANGYYRMDVRKMTAPFMLKVVADNGVDPDLYSYAAEPEVVANVTPLTNLAIYIANGSADPALLYNSWASSFGNITTAALAQAQATVNANLGTQYTAFSLDPHTYDHIGTRFYVNGTSIDGLLDALTVDISAGINIFVAGIVNVLPFDLNIDTTAFDIGGVAVATSGAYTLSLEVSVGGVSSGTHALSVNLPVSSVPTDVDSQIVQDTFVSFYGTEGTITINTVTVTADVDTPTTTVAVIDATITTVDGDVAYLATYTYTLNL